MRRRSRPVLGALSAVLAAAALSWAACAARASASETDRIVEVLGLEPGGRVADVGAGDGDWTLALARRLGSGGHVYATEVEHDLVRDIRERVRREGLDNVTVLLGDQLETGLPDRCCDALLLRMVYHHFVHPAAMRAGLRRALRPGGRVAVIDIRPQNGWRQLPDVPERGGHGIEPEELTAEMTASGFEFVARYDGWNGDEDRYCLVFRPRPDPSSEESGGS